MIINLTPQQLDYTLQALMVRPYGEVASLIQEIINQANSPQNRAVAVQEVQPQEIQNADGNPAA